MKIFSEEETKNIVVDFAKELKLSDIVILKGELGSGKTFFVKEAGKFFGINNVSSPTFAIVNEYSGRIKIYHFDFYRIEKSEELFDIGFNDYLKDDKAVIFIEWGELFPEILPRKRYEIKFTLNEDFSRVIRIDKYD